MTDKEKMKNLLQRMLDQFVEVCEQNNLHYYLAAGTVLGAIRHKGMIPWDDDIDVYLMRSDYEKIQQLPQSVWGEGMRLATWRNTPDYRYHFLKIELTDTTLIEQFDPMYVGGVYLDIFPLDDVPMDADKAREQNAEIRKCFDKYYLLNATTPNKCVSLFHYLKYQWKHFYFTRQYIQDYWEKIASRYEGTSEWVADYHSEGYDKPMMKEWFGEGVMAEFEGKQYRIPKDYDAYLTYMYGDYMTPPPITDREGHPWFYVNMEKRIDGEERKNVVREIKKKIAFQWNFKPEWKYITNKICGKK